VADAAANALLDSGHEGQAYPLVGPAALTGEAVARIYSERLGHAVRYGGNDLDAWARDAAKTLPGWLRDDLRTMYAHFQHSGLIASDEDLALARRILGRPPRALAQFVDEVFVPQAA
jgi:uncharacterized protein YbjT (DUF2867 family)